MQRDDKMFHLITLDDREWVQNKLKSDEKYKNNLFSCEYTFASNYAWRNVYKVEVAELYGCGIFRYIKHGKYSYSYPFGDGDKRVLIDQLLNETAQNGSELNMYPLSSEDRQKLLQWFPGKFLIESDRDNSDYVYTTERLSTLKGRKLHGKRNHIVRFQEANQWSYETISEKNSQECMQMLTRWIDMREDKWNDEMSHEAEALREVLSNYSELELTGGIIRSNGEIVAFDIGEKLSEDTLVIHFEKAYPKLQGAYPMINQQFVLNEASNFTYVNREEDTGDLGLRKAKLSYYPELLLKKYGATVSNVVYASEFEYEQIIEFWHTCFGDSVKYIRHYLEKRFSEDNMLVIHRDGKIVSMASFLPVTVTLGDEKQPAKYVYAVATHPEYRGRGLAAGIINYAKEKFGQPLILKPADDELCKYYQKLGFNKFLGKFEYRKNIEKSDIEKLCYGEFADEIEQKWCMKDIKAIKYKELRDNHFDSEGYVAWDEAAIEYAMEENMVCGGEAMMLTNLTDNTKHIIMYRMEKTTLNILETTLEYDELMEVSGLLMRNTPLHEVCISDNNGMIWTEQEKMCESGYLALTLG